MARDGYALAWKRYGGDRLCRSAVPRAKPS
jgi:hypothetical protein